MITKHINEYKTFPITRIPDGAMFIPVTDMVTDLGVNKDTYVYSKISDYSVEMYMGYAVEEDDLEHCVYALNSDGEIEVFESNTMVYCVSEYDYKLCI